MSKKLLSEAQIRRFQSLANMPVLSERAYAKKDDKKENEYGNESGPYSSTNPEKIDDEGHARVRPDLYPMKEVEEDMHDDAEESGMEPMDGPSKRT